MSTPNRLHVLSYAIAAGLGAVAVIAVASGTPSASWISCAGMLLLAIVTSGVPST